jgi:phage FluMu gp28-like protein
MKKEARGLDIEYTRPPLYHYQNSILNSPARYTCTAAATKCGKTASHIVWLFEQALQCKANESCWWIAPTFSQAKIAFDRMRNQVTVRSFFKVNETNLVLTMPHGAIIQFKTAEKPDNLYGADVYAAVFDEAARAREEAWFALRSTLTATGAKCKFIANVSGRKNWYYKLCQKAKAGDDPNYEYFKITAYDAAEAGMITKDGRPFIDEINDAKRDLPENVFKELYLAEASEDGSNPFGLTAISRAVYALSEAPPVCYGIDLAKSVDYTVITGLDGEGRVCHFDRFQKDWEQTKQTILKLPRNVPKRIDSTGAGDPIAEDLGRVDPNIDKFVFTSHSKQQIMEGLAVAIQTRRITVLEGVMKDELDSFEFEYTRNGVRYTGPSGMHDDCVCSLALANSIYVPQSQAGHYSLF